MVQIDEGIVLILCSSLLASSAYALIAPFFPLELEEKGVDEKYIGMIFSIYSIAVIIFSPPVGRYLEVVGYSNMLIAGLTLMGLDFVAFGFIGSLESAESVLNLVLFLRFIQGTAVAMTYTTIYAIITNKYPDRKEALLGMLEASFGVGLIFGPFAGSSLFNRFGFAMTFYIYGTTFLLATMALYCFVPTIQQAGARQPGQPDPRFLRASDSGSSVMIRSNNRDLLQEALDSPERDSVDNVSSLSSVQDDDQGKCSFLDLLGNRCFLLAACAGTMSQFVYSYMEPILAKTLEDYNLDQV